MSSERPQVALAVDIGGTFTDLVARGADGSVCTTKAPTTPGALADGVIAALRLAATDAEQVNFFVHGTTAGLNALVERRFAPVGLITTRGFRDVYEIGRANRPVMYDLRYHRPAPLVRRELRREVTERMSARGEVVTALDEPSLREASEALVERGVEAIAVVLLHAYINPAHEVRCEELLRSWYPKLSISLSHRIANEWREYERTSTTVVNAAVAPTVDSYLRDLESRVRAEGVDASIHIMQSNGGMTTASRARRQPVNTLLSGPVGGAIAASHACRQEGFKRAIAVDMGGTSFDVSLIVGGEPQLAREAALEGQPLLIPVIDVHSIGSGGGSIAWSSAGGLRVGPKSAGALPGPACYGRGGIEPTVTDANVYLNRVNADYFLGGAMHLQADRAADALDRLGRDLELKPEPLAAGIIDVVDSRMAGLIRQITVGRGLDPREFALIAFGGAGPMHAVALAEELGITTVLVPYSPGTLSAQGMLVADISHDVVRPYFSRWDRLDHAEIEALVEEMRADGRALLAEDGVRQRDASFHFSADLRYAGQEHSLTLRFKRLDEPTLRRFHRTYRRTFGHANPQEFVELVAVRMTTTGRNRRPFDVGVVEDGEGKPYTFQEVLFRQHRRVTTPRFRRGDLYRGQHLSGPLVVDEASCTTVVPDGWDVYVGESGFMRLQRKG